MNKESMITFLKAYLENKDKQTKCNCNQETLLVLKSLDDDSTLENTVMEHMGRVSLIEKILIKFFNISFIRNNNFTTASRNFDKEVFDEMIDEILKVVLSR